MQGHLAGKKGQIAMHVNLLAHYMPSATQGKHQMPREEGCIFPIAASSAVL